MARSLPIRKPIDGVKHIIVVASGKGGVGKSTTAVNLAVTLAAMGQSVGLLDADIFGPTLPLFMNLHETPLVDERNLMLPPINYGVKCNSMGLLTDESKPVVWRGPLVMAAVQRLLRGTVWGPSTDILIIDTPPGTGDVHLTLSQNIPIDGVLLVSTPQLAALEVARRGAEMYRTLKTPIIGLIENMSYVTCDKCGHDIKMFRDETEEMAKKMEVKVLARLPMQRDILESCDNGTPPCLKYPNSKFAQTYKELAAYLLSFLNITT